MANELSVEEYRSRIGEEIGVSDWVLVDQERIDRFADVTQDRQFIHVDPAKARQTPLGGTIAHGFLTLSLLSAMYYSGVPAITGSTLGLNYGMNSLRFLAPVRSGKRLRTHFRLKDFAERSPRQWQSTIEATVEIEGEQRPALIAEWLILHELRP